MLLLLLSFYVHYDLFNCEENVTGKFNESLQVDHQRQKLLQVNALLEDLEHKTRKLSVLLGDDHQHEIKRKTYVLKNVISGKARGWLKEIAPYTKNGRKRTRKATRYQSQPTVPIPPRITVPKSYWSSTGGDNLWQLLKQHQHEALNASLANNVPTPGHTPVDLHKTWTTLMTTAGDVLYGKIKVQKPSTAEPPDQRYQDLMTQLHEGYLVVFGIEMFRLIAVKDKRQVQEVLAPVEMIYKISLETGSLVDIDNPFLTIFENLATMTSEDDIDTLRTYSSMMFHTLLNRRQVLSPEVNSKIDQASLSYSDEEGKRLLRAVNHFEDYPNTNESRFWICKSLVDSILQPFRRPTDSKSRQELLSSIKDALRYSFPQLLSNSSVESSTTSSLIDPFSRSEILTGTTISRIVTQTRRKQKIKHHHHKKKGKRKGRLKPEDYNEDTGPISQELDYEQLNSFLQAITTKTIMPQSSTTAFLLSRSTQTKRIAPRKLVSPRQDRRRIQELHARVASRTGALYLLD